MGIGKKLGFKIRHSGWRLEKNNVIKVNKYFKPIKIGFALFESGHVVESPSSFNLMAITTIHILLLLITTSILNISDFRTNSTYTYCEVKTVIELTCIF
jgi:hypothetical protein